MRQNPDLIPSCLPKPHPSLYPAPQSPPTTTSKPSTASAHHSHRTCCHLHPRPGLAADSGGRGGTHVVLPRNPGQTPRGPEGTAS